MSKLKFRAWDSCNHSMKKVLRLDFDNDELLWETDEDDEVTIVSPINSIRVMQFTGLKDKNQKEIYESDLLEVDVKCYNKPTDILDLRKIIGEVVFDEGGFLVRFVDVDCKIHPEFCRIVGNKFENKELLGNGN